MNSRVSQFELRPSLEPDSKRAESSPWQPEPAADSSLKSKLACSEPVRTKSEKLSSRIPFYLIGLLLTATASAKLWMLLTDAFADVRVTLPKEILWLSVALEFWLAYLNFRLRDQRVMAFINTVTFAAFGIFASIRWLLGYTSCGCSGSLELPGWLFILIDFVIFGWFACNGLKRSQILAGHDQLWGVWSSWSPCSRGRLVGLGLFVSLNIGLQLPFAAPLRAMVLGELPIKSAVTVDEELRADQPGKATVELWNRSAEPAKIIGLSRSCSCVDFAQDPVSIIIPGNRRLVLPLAIKPNKAGPLHQRMELFLNHPKQFRVKVDVLGSVKGE